jgi:hypothetical protein
MNRFVHCYLFRAKVRSGSRVLAALFSSALLLLYAPAIDAWGRKDGESAAPRDVPAPNVPAPNVPDRENIPSRDAPVSTPDRTVAPQNRKSFDPERKQEILRIQGRVRLVGNMPFPSVVITDNENNDWYVEDADMELLRNRQQETVTVEGVPEYQDLVLANGEKIGVKRFLRNIRIIAASG